MTPQANNTRRALGGTLGDRPAEAIARAFHDEYEYLAPAYGYETRKESAVDWEDVPAQNKALMTHVVGNLLAAGIIDVGRTRA